MCAYALQVLPARRFGRAMRSYSALVRTGRRVWAWGVWGLSVGTIVEIAGSGRSFRP
jgi:hypothetical protein